MNFIAATGQRAYHLNMRVAPLLPILVLAAASLAFPQGGTAQSQVLQPAAVTVAVPDDADDPAIWINHAHPERSLIVGTNKVSAPDGALYVFGLDGEVRQIVKPLDRPNNIDIEYGLMTPHGPIDIAVATERLQSRLRVYRISENGLASIDGGGIKVLDGQTGERAMPMGIALFRRPRDGEIFAIVAPKSGATTNYLWEYQLTFDAATAVVRGTLVRRFGNFSGGGEIEAVAVDDALGYVYFADEEFALRKWHADPDVADANRELAVFGRDGFKGQREGIAIVGNPDGTGLILVADQIERTSVLRLFRREGQTGQPHNHDPAVVAIATSADDTDGIEVTRTPLAGRYPGGLLAMMNSRGRSFQLYDLGELMKLISQ